MENYMIQMEKHLEELKILLKEVDKRLAKSMKDPNTNKTITTNKENNKPSAKRECQTRIHTSLSNGCPQYYFKNGTGPRVYAKKSDMPRVKSIIQQDYDIEVRKTIVKSIKGLEQFIAKYDINSIENVYDNLCDARKRLVTPIIPSNEEYIKLWLNDNPSSGNPHYDERLYETDAGEMVRSKSEKIIADILYKSKIPYQYEPKLSLKNGLYVYPDFVVLNVKRRKTIYWEHLGMISDGEYATKALQKLSEYERNGYKLGEDIILSMESYSTPLNIKQIERMIQDYLLN